MKPVRWEPDSRGTMITASRGDWVDHNDVRQLIKKAYLEGFFQALTSSITRTLPMIAEEKWEESKANSNL